MDDRNEIIYEKGVNQDVVIKADRWSIVVVTMYPDQLLSYIIYR